MWLGIHKCVTFDIFFDWSPWFMKIEIEPTPAFVHQRVNHLWSTGRDSLVSFLGNIMLAPVVQNVIFRLVDILKILWENMDYDCVFAVDLIVSKPGWK